MSLLERVGRLLGELALHDLDALLVSRPPNVRYLTAFTGSNGLALVSSGQIIFITDFRYLTQAEEEVAPVLPGVRIEIGTGDLLELAAQLVREQEPGARVGFDDRHLTVAEHRRLCELLDGGAVLVGCGGVVEALREVKEPSEQERIAAAAQLADEALAQTLAQTGLIGRTEREIAIALELQMRTLGAESASFPTIVASGEHGALPHAQPRAVEVRRGQLVTIDWGAILDGYCSDCTRTFAAGEPSDHAREIYELVLAAQIAGLDALAVGRTGREVDAAARAVIEQAGLGDHFGHGLGHGVGLEIHESPRLSKIAPEQPLREGTVVTVEPGVYLPGELGVRIEDLVVLGCSGVRNLSSLSKELSVLQ